MKYLNKKKERKQRYQMKKKDNRDTMEEKKTIQHGHACTERT